MNPSYAICGSKHGNRCEVWLKISTALPGVCNPHGLVVEREALHGAHGHGCGCHAGEDHPRLPSELVRLRGDDVDDLAELAEDGLQRLLQLCGW